MSRETGQSKTSRRKFLRDLAAMGGVAAVATSARAGVGDSVVETTPQTLKPQGYRVTPHVAKYYDKARI